ncbi:unnamed protein product [Peniophora sp. CBMAI 1063]|nr:unnamed protein product [Peniophora sp. CBMAI 1063]
MIAEVLLVLAGHESSLFPDGSSLHPAFDPLLHPGEKQCLESLGSLASRYRNIKSTVSGLARSQSQYLCALCATLTQILRDEYEALVVTTEAQILNRDPSLVASGSYVPLSALRAAFAHWDAPLAALEVLLADICGRPESQWPPGLLIDTLLSRASTGTHSISDIIGRLACAVQRVWQTEIIALLVHGSLSSIEPLAESDYTLREGYVPSCVSATSRAAVSYVGRALGTVKAAQAQTRLPRELVARHTEILQDILVQDTYKFDRAVGEIRTNVSEWLWMNVLTQKNVDEAVDSLSNYFLLRNGEFSTALIRELERLKFTRLTTRSNLIREQDLHLALLRASLGTSAQHDPSLLRLRFTLPTGPLRPLLPTLPKAADITASAEMEATPAFDDLLLGTPLLLSYTVSWPLDLFLTPTDLALYAALFGYLSALRRTHARVHTAWASLSNAQRARRKWTGLGEGGTREDLESRERLLRCGWGVVRCMGWFLDCLLGYTMSDVVDAEYLKLKSAVAGAPSTKGQGQSNDAKRRARASSVASVAQKSTISKLDSAEPGEALDFTTLRALHSAYLERLLAGSLLGNAALAAVLRPIFELCDAFVAHVERWGGDVLPALLAEGSVSGGGDGVGKMVKERWEIVSEINEALNTLLDSFYEQLTQSTAQPIRPDISRSVFNATAANMTSAFKIGNTTTMRRDARLRENEGETRRQIERLLLRLDFNEEFTRKFYAVKVGRFGPDIYETWDECKDAVHRFPGAVYKSHLTLREAEDWLARQDAVSRSRVPSHGYTLQGEMPVAGRSGKSGDDFIRLEPDEPRTGMSTGGSISHPTGVMPTGGEIQLSAEQRAILERVRRGESLFFTGPAGTGKSVLLREIIKMLRERPYEHLAITATTGVAALNIGGQTIHSWSGIGVARLEFEKLRWKIRMNPDLNERWLKARCLILDEISMLEGRIFDLLESLARWLRDDERPFGGMQIIISGDFLQLPPIPDRDSNKHVPALFAFEAHSWEGCLGSPVHLTQIFRQKDPSFASMLSAARTGDVTEEIARKFKKLARPVHYDDGIGPTELYPTKAEVFRANKQRLDLIRDTMHNFVSHDISGVDDDGKELTRKERDLLLDKQVAQKTIQLKVGAQVMLIKNTIQGVLVNGSVGVITAFMTVAEAARHKMTVVDTRTEKDVKQKKDAVPAIVKQRPEAVWPYVRFTNGREMLCIPQDFNQENRNGDMEASRVQVPLILAWALSVHKSQGQTLERVKIDLARTFEKGQAYVALSRATNLKTLEVYNFAAHRVVAHPRVLAWMRAQKGRPAVHADSDSYDYDAFMDCEEAMLAYHGP